MKKIGRIAICVIAGLMMVWFLAPIVTRVLNIGNILGIIICLVLLFRFGTNKLYRRFVEKVCKRKATRALYRILCVLCTLFLIYAGCISTAMIICACHNPAQNATAVVLGAQVKPWGPSVSLRQRIEAAERYLNEVQRAVAVLTGGQGEDEVESEAACMLRVMTEDGIAPNRLYAEDQATNTLENIKFSLRIIEKEELNRNLAIVSDSYHQLRARIIAKKIDPDLQLGAVNTVNGRVGLWLYPTYFVREWIAIPYEIIK